MPGRAGVRLDRLGLGDWIDGAASLALLVVLFAVPWYGYRASFAPILAHGSGPMTAAFGMYRATGWETFGVLGPLAVVVAALGVAIWLSSVTRRSPVVPVALTVLQAPLAGVLAIALAVRVLIDSPQVLLAGPRGGNALQALPGAYVGLVLAVAILAGSYLSLRRDGVATGDAPTEIETLDLSGTRSAGHA